MALECLLDGTSDAPELADLYVKIAFPESPTDRPYIYVNMVSTVDGKIVIGKIGGTAKGVGGPTDQKLFRRLQKNCDAALVGSSTLRASDVIYPPDIARFVVTRSGDLPLKNRFFTDAPDRAYILAPKNLQSDPVSKLPSSQVLRFGQDSVDLKQAMRHLREQMGIHTLLCEGGATLNDELLRASLVDELFLTLSPKLKGGAHLPTIVTGQGFAPGKYLSLTLLSVYKDESELYLRYRVS